MIFKWIFLVAFVFLVFWLLKQFRPKQKRSPDTSAKVIEDMVRCAYCGIHLPQSESIVENGQGFCCIEHHQLFLQSKPLRRRRKPGKES